MKTTMSILIPIMAFGLVCALCIGKTITVDDDGPADFSTIQAAIADAGTVNGDEIVVAPGTYYEAVNFLGKAVRLYSSGGPGVTTIDGSGAEHVVQCISGEDPNTILEGFTITGGNTITGGGMYNDNNSSPTVTNCTFSNNEALEGGGMYNYFSSPIVTNCTFSGNTAGGHGGGMYNDTSSPTVTNCTFSGNTGNGMSNTSSNPTVTNCTFSKNTFSGNGGGMYNQSSSLTLTNCTFTGNSAGMNGGGMYNYISSPTVTNCIFWGNSPDEIYYSSSTPIVTYSDVRYGTGQSWFGTGCIDADPLFADAASGNLRLSSGSPCIDAGDNTAVPGDITTDLEGHPRFIDDPASVDTGYGSPPIVDMGAFEFSAPHLLSPNGGEILPAGRTHAITWQTLVPVSDIVVEYSIDDGALWQAVWPANQGNTGSYDWLVPAHPSGQCRVRISQADDPTQSDTSDGLFSIRGLVAHWKLDQTRGDRAPDSAGTNHGSLVGQPHWLPIGGPIGGALQLDGVDDYVDCGNGPDLNITDQITLAAWVKTADSGNGQYNPYIAKGDTAFILQHNNSNYIDFCLYDTWWYAVWYPIDSSFNDQWHHLAGTYDANDLKLYIDGSPVAAVPYDGRFINTTANNVSIGRNSASLYEGLIDEVRIYNYALDADEIMQLLCTEPIKSDLDRNCKTDIADLAVLAADWMTCNMAAEDLCRR